MMLASILDESERRLAAIRNAMQGRVDVLLIYSKAWKPEYIHYGANYRILGRDACMVLPLEGEPCLILSEPWDERRARLESWVRDVRSAPSDLMSQAGRLARRAGKRIGLVGVEILSRTQTGELTKALDGAGFSNELALLDRVALVKTKWEVEILRKSASFADDGFQAELEALRPGISEFELVAEIEYAMRSRGSDDNFQMIGVGRDLTGMNVPRENRVQPGDFVLSEITPMIGCITYAAQLCRTVKVGAATDLEKEKYGMLVEALDASLDLIRPGVPACEVARKQNQIIGAGGYARYCGPPYMRSRGHNFGLGHLELEEENQMPFQANMVMVVHPNQFIPETGYLACGETILVTEAGCERLNRLPAKLYEI